jgi:predicted outer membrane repeat protein
MKFTVRACFTAFLLLCLVIPAGEAAARTYYLQADGGGDFPDLASALSHAISSDVIELEDGIYGGPGNRNLDFHGRAITIRSRSGNPAGCILDADGSASNPGRLFHFNSGEGVGTRLQQLTLRGGWVDGDDYAGLGGAILIRHADPQIEECIFSGNRATGGGAIACLTSSPQITGCEFRDNQATAGGGGISLDAGSHPTITHSLFHANSAGYGGGIHCFSSSPTLLHVTCVANTGSVRGGGIYLGNVSNPFLQHCTLAWNSSPWGGGISLVMGSLPVIDRCIIAASEAGGAITALYSSLATFTCSDLFGNEGGDWIGDHAIQLGSYGNISQDPLFCGDAGSGEYGLETGSPCTVGECGLIGAWSVACSGRRTLETAFSWGAIKTLY